MNKSIFVNSSFTYAVNEYLNSKNQPEGIKYNSFFVVIIRLLTMVYDELDILNPFYLNDEKSLFINLSKYGYSKENINNFLNNMDNFYQKENDIDFINIQKNVVDMLVKKKLSMTLKNSDLDKFRYLLYSPYASNSLIVSYNFLMAKDPMEIINYFDLQMKTNNKKVITKAKETLNLEAYEILKYSLEDIKSMNSDELDEINKEVYNYFNINANAINKSYLLDKAVFDYNHPKVSLSTGNGYVDILFVLSIMATLAMIIIIVTLLVL